MIGYLSTFIATRNGVAVFHAEVKSMAETSGAETHHVVTIEKCFLFGGRANRGMLIR
jgi:hypothetical protein